MRRALPALLGLCAPPVSAAGEALAPAGLIGWGLAAGFAILAAVLWGRLKATRPGLETSRAAETVAVPDERGRAALSTLAEALAHAVGALQTMSEIERTALREVRQAVATATRSMGELQGLLHTRPPSDEPRLEVTEGDPEAGLIALESAASSIGDKFARLHERTDEIARAVGNLDKVSERINLLSLNAAIESEKAGERGHGFVAIAQEIRRLADHTAATSLGIGRHVGRTREVVSEGVMSVERFQAEVHEGVNALRRLAGPRPGGGSRGLEAADAAALPDALKRLGEAAAQLGTASRALSVEDDPAGERLREIIGLSRELSALAATVGPAGAAPR